MGLKEVLSKMKIVEMEAHLQADQADQAGPAGHLAEPAPGTGAPGRPAGGSAARPAQPVRPADERALDRGATGGPRGSAGSPGSSARPSGGAAPAGVGGAGAGGGERSGAAPGAARAPGSASAPGTAALRAGSPPLGKILEGIPELPEIDEKVLAPPAAGEELPDFPAIYQAAGVVEPAHGYSAAKVFEILSAPDFAGLEPRAKAAALAGFLKMNPSGPVPLADVIQDAVHRDQALDKFDQMLHARLRSHAEQVERDNAALQAEIDALTRRNREKMDANRGALAAEQARLERWQTAKRAEERKLAAAVAPFVEKNPITTDPLPDSAPAEAKRTDH
jgi:hypothetical protein